MRDAEQVDYEEESGNLRGGCRGNREEGGNMLFVPWQMNS
jgi:hypothetical protein